MSLENLALLLSGDILVPKILVQVRGRSFTCFWFAVTVFCVDVTFYHFSFPLRTKKGSLHSTFYSGKDAFVAKIVCRNSGSCKNLFTQTFQYHLKTKLFFFPISFGLFLPETKQIWVMGSQRASPFWGHRVVFIYSSRGVLNNDRRTHLLEPQQPTCWLIKSLSKWIMGCPHRLCQSR